ncbi:hypothetical protein GCM10009557_29200 [Virgisporangium ochraceum]|uniref:DUF3558 domain-containing protein n=1 Tax=Virgisporangium ochraceum TaxID=65505 RepID=A0A8J4EGJ4_9ACTN|nr:hypothetical protein [Virgisporangium ochraceum]GIJ73796.1 hypothetical protein Voc01_087130 [Virgisporangium ochraceum]
MRRLVTLGVVALMLGGGSVLGGCSVLGRHEVKKPQRLTSTLCDAIGVDALRGLVPDGKIEQYAGADDNLVDDLADAGCNVTVANDAGWGDVRILVRRAGQTATSTAREYAGTLLRTECGKIAEPGWATGMAEHNRDFTAGPPTEPTGVGDEACMITAEHTLLDDRVAQVWVYARRGIEFVQLEYTWGGGDITAMSAKAVDLTRAVFGARLS